VDIYYWQVSTNHTFEKGVNCTGMLCWR